MTAATVAFRDVSRTYGGQAPVHALRGVSLDIHSGDFVAITGPSGSGKSTLLGLLGLLDRPTSGSIEIDGQAVERLNDRALSEVRGSTIGFVFQQFHLIGHLTAGANVEAALLFRGLSSSERRRMAREALDRVGLAGRVDHRPNQLSGGEQQRVAIARALVTEPRLILADEPTGNLDSRNAAAIVELLESVGERSALVVVTHDLALAQRADRQIVLLDGEVQQGRAAGRKRQR